MAAVSWAIIVTTRCRRSRLIVSSSARSWATYERASAMAALMTRPDRQDVAGHQAVVRPAHGEPRQGVSGQGEAPALGNGPGDRDDAEPVAEGDHGSPAVRQRAHQEDEALADRKIVEQDGSG